MQDDNFAHLVKQDFEVLETIGAGGMGVVYKAKDANLEKIVAIKALPSHLSVRFGYPVQKGNAKSSETAASGDRTSAFWAFFAQWAVVLRHGLCGGHGSGASYCPTATAK